MLSAPVASQKKNILVVDDAPENLRILLNALSEEGYSVRCARTGNLAIAGSQITPPDLVLLDILMPQMDGFEVCQKLRQDIRTGNVPIIFLSALDDGSDKARAFAMGGDDYIAKPFNIDEVLARVKHQLNLRQRHALLQRRAEDYRRTSYELRDAYTLLLEVLNSLTEGVAAFQPIFDDEGRIVDFKSTIANAAFLRFISPDGEPSALAEATLRTSIAHYSDCELYDLCLQVVDANESLKRELLCLKGEQQQWVEVFATKLRDGVVTSLRDISDSKEQITTLETMKRELYTLATTDVLTQVGNRYQFESYFATEWQRSVREQQPLSLLMADIDRFKRFNDICGHQVGDRCLREVAQVLQTVVKRPTDLVARYGGEEFAIILPNTPLRGAMTMAHNIQTAMRELRLIDVSSPECEQVRLSIGISSTIPQVHRLPLDLVEAADRALYSAKALGGNTNCVEMI